MEQGSAKESRCQPALAWLHHRRLDQGDERHLRCNVRLIFITQHYKCEIHGKTFGEMTEMLSLSGSSILLLTTTRTALRPGHQEQDPSQAFLCSKPPDMLL